MADDSFYGFEPVANLTISVVEDVVTRTNSTLSMSQTSLALPAHHNSSTIVDLHRPSVFENFSHAFVPMNTTSYVVNWQEQQNILLQRILYGIAFAIIAIACAIGNCTVIWIVLSHRKMRTVTNYAIAHLALADLMLGSWNPMLVCQFLVTQQWLYGTALCVISNFIAHHSIALSVFTLISISIDRYMAIMRPLKSQPRSSKRLLITLIIIWLAAFVVSLPPLLFSRVETVEEDGRKVCVFSFPVGVYWDLVFNSLFMLVTYGIPMILLGITYIRIGLHLWNQEIIGNLSEAQLAQIQQKRRLVRVLIWVLVSFLVCWFPYQLYFVVSNVWVSVSEVPGIQHVYMWYVHFRFYRYDLLLQPVHVSFGLTSTHSFYWLAMSSSVYNPIIYVILNKNYRKCFRSAWGWLPGIRSSRHQRSRLFLSNDALSAANANNMSLSLNDSGRSSHNSQGGKHHGSATRTSSHEMTNLSATSTFSSCMNVSPARSPNLVVLNNHILLNVRRNSPFNLFRRDTGNNSTFHYPEEPAPSQVADAALLYKFMHSGKSASTQEKLKEEKSLWVPQIEIEGENQTSSQTAALLGPSSITKNGIGGAAESDVREHRQTRGSRQPSVIQEEELETALELQAEVDDDDVEEDCFKD